ncbi:GNAT family N-acetyltransferase [Chloroflexota bacterium]
MNTDSEDLMQLNKSQVVRAVEVLTRAFWNHPPLNYYFPDENEREKIAYYFFSVSILHCIRYGEVYAPSRDFQGIALWLSSDKYPISLWRMLRSVPLSQIIGFGRHGGSRMKGLGNYIDGMQERLAPFRHWYLQAIGVSPDFQGKGYAGRLLNPVLSRLDREGLTCYLETLEERNVSLYQHFGFKVIDESRVPETALTSWAMLREAQ